MNALKKISLTQYIIISMFVGILVGYFAPDFAKNLQVFSLIFIRLIKCIVAPLIFATVVLYRDGKLITGTETDLDGNFMIADVQPGTYDFEASYVGFATQKIQGVVVKAGRNNVVNFSLSSDNITLSEIQVIAYKVPLIEFDNTTQGSTVTAEKIRNLPTKNVNEITARSAGISSRDGGDISIRGSRANETDYFLDGVRVTGNLIPQSEIQGKKGKENNFTQCNYCDLCNEKLRSGKFPQCCKR